MKRKTAKPVIEIKVVRLAHGKGLDLPAYQTSGAAGTVCGANAKQHARRVGEDRAANPPMRKCRP